MDSLLLWTTGTGVLLTVSFVALSATIIFRKRMDEETAHIFFGLIPFELMILVWGTPFFLCLCFFLV